MRDGMTRRLTVFVVWGAILVGVAGTVVALRGRGGQEAFLVQQQTPLTISAR
jgi:hypothetical protein